MRNKIVCFLLGHDYDINKEYVGDLSTGVKAYKQVLGDYVRCKKPYKKELKDVQLPKE